MEKKVYYHIMVKLPEIAGQTSSFPVDENGFTDITSIIADKSLKINKNLMKNFKFAQDTVKAKTIYNEEINKRFFLSTEYIPAYVGISTDIESGIYGYFDGSTPEEDNYGWDAFSEYGFDERREGSIRRIFTGAIAPLTKEKLGGNGAEGVEFEIVDNNYLLEVDCPDLIYPKNPKEKWWIYNTSQNFNVVSDLLSHTNYFTSNVIIGSPFYIASETQILKAVNLIVEKKEKRKISEILNDLLYYYHCTYYFDGLGNFHIYDWGKKTNPVINAQTDTLEESDVQNKSGIQRTRKFIKEDSYNFIYKPIKFKKNALVYREDNLIETETKIDEEGNVETVEEKGKLISGGAYLPADPIHEKNDENPDIYPIEAYQSYEGNWLAKEAKILASYNHTIKIKKDSALEFVNPTDVNESGAGGRGSLDTVITEKELTFLQDKARIVLKNTTSNPARLYNFDIRADVHYEVGDANYKIPQYIEHPDGTKTIPERTKEIKLKYITKSYNEKGEIDKDSATVVEEFGQAYYNYVAKNGQFSYKFSTLKPLTFGKVYFIKTKTYMVKAIPTSSKYDVETGIYDYELLGVDDMQIVHVGESEDNIGGLDVPEVELKSFDLYSNRKNFPTSSRYVTQHEEIIKFWIARNGEVTGDAKWTVSDAQPDIIVKHPYINPDLPEAELNKPENLDNDKLIMIIPVSCKQSIPISVSAEIVGEPTLGKKVINISVIPTGVKTPTDILPPKGEQWIADPNPDKGEVRKVPTQTNKSEPLVNGDWFTNRDGVAYIFNQSVPDFWVKVDGVENAIDEENYLNATLSSVNKVLSGQTEVEVTDKTCSTYGWFKQLVALEAVIQNLFARNVIVEKTFETPALGIRKFIFKVQTTSLETGEPLAEPIWEVKYGMPTYMRTIFKIFPKTGNIFFGEPNYDGSEPKVGFMYDRGNDQIKTRYGRFIIKSNGELEAVNARFVNAYANGMTARNFSFISGDYKIKTTFSHLSDKDFYLDDIYHYSKIPIIGRNRDGDGIAPQAMEGMVSTTFWWYLNHGAGSSDGVWTYSDGFIPLLPEHGTSYVFNNTPCFTEDHGAVIPDPYEQHPTYPRLDMTLIRKGGGPYVDDYNHSTNGIYFYGPRGYLLPHNSGKGAFVSMDFVTYQRIPLTVTAEQETLKQLLDRTSDDAVGFSYRFDSSNTGEVGTVPICLDKHVRYVLTDSSESMYEAWFVFPEELESNRLCGLYERQFIDSNDIMLRARVQKNGSPYGIFDIRAYDWDYCINIDDFNAVYDIWLEPVV